MNETKELLIQLIKVKIKNHKCPECNKKKLTVLPHPYYQLNYIDEEWKDTEHIYISCTNERRDGDMCIFESTWDVYKDRTN